MLILVLKLTSHFDLQPLSGIFKFESFAVAVDFSVFILLSCCLFCFRVCICFVFSYSLAVIAVVFGAESDESVNLLYQYD
jgi:hypothetical protein